MFPVCSRILLFLLLAAGLCGCSGGGATVTGKVTAEGQDVTGGTIVLSPIAGGDPSPPGKPGLTDLRPDGSYSISLEPGPNGLARSFTVGFTPPWPAGVTSKTKDVVVPYQGLVPKQTEVEIKPGNNVINVELIPRPQN
jgi:hypothetical protein